MIIALGQYTWSDYIGCDMLSSPLESIHDRTMLGVTGYHCPWKSLRSYDVGRGMPAWPLGGTHAWITLGMGCHYRLCTTYMVGRDHACNAIIVIWKHKWSDDVGRYMPSFPSTTLTVGRLRRGMALSHLDSIYGRRMSGESFHHGYCPEHTIE